MVPLFAAVSGRSLKGAAGAAGAAGLLANLGVYYWIYPTCRAAGLAAPVSLLAWSALSAYLALYWAAFGLSSRLFQISAPRAWPVLAAAAWAALEWIRSWAFTGFPWLPLSASQWRAPFFLSLADVGGGYMVSFWIVLANAAVAAALLQRPAARRAAVWPAAALWALLLAGTAQRWSRPAAPAGPPLSVAIVQGNIDQYRKWNEAYENDIVDVYSRLTARAAEEPTDLIVWPETAVPGWIPNEIKFTRWLEDTARSAGAFLLAGAATHQQKGDYNAAFLFTPQGHILAQYRKQHLVPFGEFVPLQPILSRFISVLNELGDFHGSDDKTVFQLPEVRFSVNICFEDLFPGLVRDFVRRGAQLTVNITNDGWYLDTAAPEQHFTANVLRAVETRTWIVRAANTGVSGFIDPKGRVVARTRLQEEAVLRGAPSPMAGETFYVRRGDLFAWACALAATVGALLSLRRKLI